MDYKQKYEEALNKAKVFYETKSPDCLILESIFPELAESEDEKIRKAIKSILAFSPTAMFDKVSISREDAISWLEKQGEQKSVWSEEDERTLNNIIEEIEPFGECPDYPTDEDREYYYVRTKMIDWLKSLKYRIKGE